ncbi:pyridoxal 5'-phosphate synthase glutaminase subunit PdxT [Anaerobium acetethylicum]|uniref:Pyridoxal 5'-phosphate synthase subunit PdxT n=1 Tax=Anaerobium acetethylicum TaxID=1619234 RepID=A0A1D3TTA9_9FIRM|nr:pyridoxal 5'-phosphate synthase glutaminase subunit PdxT [Anaerobium acetethylicum]SCP97207.1 5'-phosphate synthase pdxT subunit [Anaerobium acetethylicum]
MKIAVLAVQGAFAEHEQMLEELGVEHFEIRRKEDLDRNFDGLILPGGESTVQGKLLKELDLYEELKKRIEGGLPVFGTCAGLILLAGELSNDTGVGFGTLPVVVRRNAYGRQLGSFTVEEEVRGVGKIPMVFIRAPYIEEAFEGAEVIAATGGNIVGVRCGNQVGISFHPEVTGNTDMHRYFVEMVRESIS